MHITTIKTPGLAHLSYIVQSKGLAAVIDPRIDLRAYLKHARREGLRITHIFETHRNEDIVSGARALSEVTGAKVLHGAALDWEYGTDAGAGDSFELGDVVIDVLNTPGHTDESLSFAVRHCETGDEVVGVFTGDALFVNDVGRTDFYPERAREVAGLLYDSIHKVLLPLGEHAIVWPAHGAGSVCGDGMADRDFTTLGYERQNNPLLQLDREAFIDRKVSEEHTHPPYFSEMERVNKAGATRRSKRPVTPVPPEELDGTLVDVRPPEAWAGCHADGSLCLPVSMLTAWAGWWLPYDEPLHLIAEDGDQAEQARKHLARIGYTRVSKRLRGGPKTWQTAGSSIRTTPGISASELAEKTDEVTVLDVRKQNEWESGHIEGAMHIPLHELAERADEVPRDTPVVTVCGSGRRATLAAALLERAGLPDVCICFGSMAAWKSLGFPVV